MIQALVSPDTDHYDSVAIHYFTQYQLHLQLMDAVDYAHKNGIIIKGDLPIGVGRHSVDTWMNPSLFHMDMQAGAPPDAFTVKGQNWSFPTYNWEVMQQNDCLVAPAYGTHEQLFRCDPYRSYTGFLQDMEYSHACR